MKNTIVAIFLFFQIFSAQAQIETIKIRKDTIHNPIGRKMQYGFQSNLLVNRFYTEHPLIHNLTLKNSLANEYVPLLFIFTVAIESEVRFYKKIGKQKYRYWNLGFSLRTVYGVPKSQYRDGSKPPADYRELGNYYFVPPFSSDSFVCAFHGGVAIRKQWTKNTHYEFGAEVYWPSVSIMYPFTPIPTLTLRIGWNSF